MKALAVGVIALLIGMLPFAVFLMLSHPNPNYAPPPRTETFKPWWWEPINVSEHYKEISPREYVITKPLTWHEATLAVWEGKGSFEYAFAAYEPSKQLLFDYVYKAGGSCQRLRKIYSSYLNMPYPTKYTAYLRNNCSFLKLVYFSSTPSWYASLNLIGYFKKLYFKQVHPKQYWLFILVFNASDGMHVKIYNVVNKEDLNELVNDIKLLKATHPTLLIKVFGGKFSWYGRYLQIIESKTPFLLMYDDDYNTFNSSLTETNNVFSKIFGGIDPRLSDPEIGQQIIIDDGEILLKNGKATAFYGVSCRFLKENLNITCLPWNAPIPKQP